MQCKMSIQNCRLKERSSRNISTNTSPDKRKIEEERNHLPHGINTSYISTNLTSFLENKTERSLPQKISRYTIHRGVIQWPRKGLIPGVSCFEIPPVNALSIRKLSQQNDGQRTCFIPVDKRLPSYPRG